jgi:hypothetical protein
MIKRVIGRSCVLFSRRRQLKAPRERTDLGVFMRWKEGTFDGA